MPKGRVPTVGEAPRERPARAEKSPWSRQDGVPRPLKAEVLLCSPKRPLQLSPSLQRLSGPDHVCISFQESWEEKE